MAQKARELAARILNTGTSKIWISPESLKRIKESITSDDIRALIKENLIKKLKQNEQSRVRGRVLAKKKNKGRRRGPGKRKGTFKARGNSKKQWIRSIRAIRKRLIELKNEKKVDSKEYRKLYNMAKSNMIKNKKSIDLMIVRIKEQKVQA